MKGLKEKYEQLKSDYLICSEEEAEQAFHFVSKVIQLEIERMKTDEPYATNAIVRLEATESEVYGLYDEMQEYIAEGED